MDVIFKNMSDEKRDKIINSALEEFSKNSFEKASTNNIVKKAGISKGLLFHYFSNKKELYEKLEEFTLKTVTEKVKNEVDWQGTDIFDRLKQITLIKLKIINQYPFIYDFALMLLEKKSIEALKKQTKEMSPDLISKVYTYNIDFSLFKEGIDKERAMKIIEWTLEKMGEEIIRKRISEDKKIDFTHMVDEAEKYTEILRKAFYKQ